LTHLNGKSLGKQIKVSDLVDVTLEDNSEEAIAARTTARETLAYVDNISKKKHLT